MKTNSQRTERILQKVQQKKQRQKAVRTAVASVALVGLTAFSFVLFTPYKAEPTVAEKYKNSEYRNVIYAIDGLTPKSVYKKNYKNNFDKWSKQLLSALGGFGTDKGANAAPEYGEISSELQWAEDNEWVEEGDMATGEGSGASDMEYVETTDNQVQGVIEGDLFKRTNSHIFYLDTNSDTLRVYSIAGTESNQVYALPIDMQGGSRVLNHQPQIYLSKDGKRLTLLMSVTQRAATAWERYTVAVGYDVSNPTAVKELDRTYLSGDFVSSRMTDGSLLLINDFSVAYKHDFENKQSFLPHFGRLNALQPVAGEDIVCPENASVKRYTVLCEIDPETFAVSDCTALFSYSSEAYVSKENIFVTRAFSAKEEVSETEYKTMTKTELSCVYYGGEGLEYKGTATVDGLVKNQYSMDEYNGVLRVATTNGEQVCKKREDGPYWSRSTVEGGSLYCIDLNSFEVVASVEKFIEGETVESVRFDKEKAYICTAVVITLTDPVFVFDLSDLENITYVDTGEIEGYSTSLVDFKGDYLLGIGYGAGGGFKAEIYIETPMGVESVCSYEADGNFSEDYKSYYINREKGLVGLCVGGNYLLLAFDDYGLNSIIDASLPMVCGFHLIRATLIEDCFYIIGAGANNILVVDIYE